VSERCHHPYTPSACLPPPASVQTQPLAPRITPWRTPQLHAKPQPRLKGRNVGFTAGGDALLLSTRWDLTTERVGEPILSRPVGWRGPAALRRRCWKPKPHSLRVGIFETMTAALRGKPSAGTTTPWVACAPCNAGVAAALSRWLDRTTTLRVGATRRCTLLPTRPTGRLHCRIASSANLRHTEPTLISRDSSSYLCSSALLPTPTHASPPTLRWPTRR
jgi:hypothetical protein